MLPEEIPDPDPLYRQVREPQHINPANGEFSSATFGDTELSVDWSRHSTPTETAGRHSSVGMVVEITAGKCRKIGLEVTHNPLHEGEPDGPNPAHTLVKGKKRQAIKTSLKADARIVWRRGEVATPEASTSSGA
jgi:hypothetical protein